jgi:hypothetical protein
MPSDLKSLHQLVQVKPEMPETTPSLRDAINKGAATVGCYLFTPTLRQYFREIFESVIHKKGQGYWLQAEYGVGKTHFLATGSLLVTEGPAGIWSAVKDDELRREFQESLQRVRLFPVCFSLLGAGENDAQDRLMRRFEKEIQASLPANLRDTVSVVSEQLATDWYERDARTYEKTAVEAYFRDKHGTTPEAYRKKSGKKKFGSEILQVGLTIDLKGSFVERFVHIYDQITAHGYDGMLFVVDEFRSWQDRHEGRDSFQEGCQVLESLAYVLPVEEHRNVLTIVASQGDVPQKLMGGGQGDRFIVRPLLGDRSRNEYGEIVAYRVRDLRDGGEIDVDEYYNHCRENFRFLRQANTSKKHFQAIFPFQPRCFELLRRITQSFERHQLPAARSGIISAWETLQQQPVLTGKRLVVPSDFLNSEQLTVGLRSENFRAGFEAFQAACDVLDTLPMPDDEKDAAARIIGVLYLMSAAMPENARAMTLADLAEATMTDIEGLKCEDAVLDLVTQLKGQITQIKYDKDKGAWFEFAEGEQAKPEKYFGPLKRKAKSDTNAQNELWLKSLFWDFKALAGAGSDAGIDNAMLCGLADLDQDGDPVLPNGTAAKRAKVRKVFYGGEVIVADQWSPKLGEAWSNKPEVHFRVVYLSRPTRIPEADLVDPRIAVCVPAELSEETRDNLADILAYDEMLRKWTDPCDAAVRDWARSKRHEAVAALLPNHIAEYRRGKVVTAKGIGIQANEVFKIASDSRSSREDELARQLLEKAYDEPLFQYQEFKKDFQDADARKVLHGLFRPVNARSGADNSARDNFGAGLGVIAKSNPTDFAPQPAGALGWIQDRMRTHQDVALSDLVNELCRPPHGLTEPMVTLLALCAVRAADPPLVVTNLNPSAGFTLATGKPPAGNKLTAHQLPQVEWSGKLEKALLGARLEFSTETSWNTVLPWAKVLAPDLKTSNNPAEELERNDELLSVLAGLQQQVPTVQRILGRLQQFLGGEGIPELDLVFQQLANMAATASFQEFYAVAREAYPDAKVDLEPNWQLYERAIRLTERYADVQTIKSYAEACPNLATADVATERNTLATVLTVPQLLKPTNRLAIAEEAFRRLKDKHSHAYRKAHRDHHEQLGKLNSRLQPLARKLTAIARLNELELGSPLGAELDHRHRQLLAATDACAAKDQANVDQQPICPLCRWDGRPGCPSAEVDALAVAVQEAIDQLTVRVSRGTVRKLLEEHPDANVRTLLEIILASQTDRLADVLTSEVVERIRQVLQDANLEPRDLPVQDLLGELTAVEEEDIESLVRQIEQRLRAAFKQAKAETDGKKRVRFFLK